MRTLKDVLHEVLRESPVPVKHLAEQLGISYSMLSNAGNPELEEFKLQARLLIQLTLMTGDYRLLDFLEMSCGRVALDLPAIQREAGAVAPLVAESTSAFGQVLATTGEALRDGQVDRIEIKRLEKSIDRHLQAVMELKQALQQLSERS